MGICGVGCGNWRRLRTVKWLVRIGSVLVAKKTFFSARAKPPEKEKFFLGAPRQHFSTVPKLTEVNKFHLRKPYCELAVQHPFFESQQSCVCTTASLSHRFKSSPAISGKVEIPGAAGYMMMAGYFRRNHVSSGDLNRSPESRGPQPSACFCGTFCTPQKVPIRTPLPGASRFSQPRISTPK